MNTQFLFGSKLLQLDNCRDLDYVHFDPPKLVAVQGQHHLNHEKEHIKRLFKLVENYKVDTRNGNLSIMTFLYQYSRCFHPEKDYPIDCDIRDSKSAWIHALKSYVNDDDMKKKSTSNRSFIRKNFYHIMYQYFMIVDNVVWLEGEHKKIVQKIHDNEMPVENYQEFQKLINAL